jgi:DNA-binding FadR family transcriptional regulator
MPIQNKQEKVIIQIEKAILSRELKPGDKLPSERDLQDQYKSGRGTVREALKGLEQKGLIEIKKGSKGGAFIKEVDSEQVSQILAMLIRHRRISIEHLAEFREAVEGSTAAHAAERASRKDIEKLKGLMEKGVQLAGAKKINEKEFYQWELGMHLELARISRNPLFEWISGTLYLNLLPFRTLLSSSSAAVQEALEDWEDIVAAMEKGQVVRVCSIVKAHITKYGRMMSQDSKD